jgi:hypothetical protein
VFSSAFSFPVFALFLGGTALLGQITPELYPFGKSLKSPYPISKTAIINKLRFLRFCSKNGYFPSISGLDTFSNPSTILFGE